jgi:MFS family permease
MVVFALVAAAFTNIYITQPVLLVLQVEFNTDTVVVSYTVAAVILGVAIATLPFGSLVDHMPIKLLPKDTSRKMMAHRHTNYLSLLCRRDLLRIYFLASGSFFIFSAIFNFL